MNKNELYDEWKIEQDIEALALFIFDIYMDKKQREQIDSAAKDD